MTTTHSKLRVGFLAEMHRYPADGWIAGVCRGIADYFDWKVAWVRLLVVLMALFTAFWPVFIVYCIFWYVMDSADLGSPGRPKWSDMPIAAATRNSQANANVDLRDIKERFGRLDERLRRLEEAALNKDEALRREIDKLSGVPPQG
jgi:phage shock protein C